MNSIKLTLQQARNIQLSTLGLLNVPTKRATKHDVLQAIKNLSVLQIDTISVVNRSPYLVLFSRIGEFKLEWVEELLAERKLFEYWSHEACFLPIENYPLYNAMIHNKKARGFNWSKEWIHTNRKDAKIVLDYVTKNGKTMSSAFKNTGEKKGGWWNWKVEKVALDMLYTQGKLTIVGRKNFHRIYDLTERGIPEKFLAEKVPLSKVYEEFIERSVKHLGITKKSWVSDYFRLKKTVAVPVFDKLLKRKKFIEVQVEGFEESFFVHVENEYLIQQSLKNQLTPTLTTLLSPFDPLIWDRKRVKELFDFDYQIECYTPLQKRIYGYFTLPILYKGQLIGRMDAKAHRKEKRFEVKALHFEKDFVPDKKCIAELKKALHQFANWHGTPDVVITKVVPESYSLELHF